MSRELDGYGCCPGCGGNFIGCVGVYHCPYGCEEPEHEPETVIKICDTDDFHGPQCRQQAAE